MDERKFGRILETGMGFCMSFVLNTTAMYLLGAPMQILNILQGWVGAIAIAIAINYLFPCMDWALKITHSIQNKAAEYFVRVLIFSFFEIFLNSVWCMLNANVIAYWPSKFPMLLLAGTISIFLLLPIWTRIAAYFSKK